MTLRDPNASSGPLPGRPPAALSTQTGSDAPASASGRTIADPSHAAPPVSEATLGLRLRVWMACVSGALVSALGLWWVAGTQLTLNPDPPLLLGWLAGIGGLGLVVAVGFALWLDHGIVVHLRGLTRGLASGRVQELRGLPAASGWGELSELTEWAQVLITRQRLSNRTAEELERLEAALALALGRLEGWRNTDRWEPLAAESGTGGDLARQLNESFARASELNEQNLEAARRVRAELIGAVGDARDCAVQAEGGFVEATALLTTVRELQRLGQELRQTLAAAAPSAAPSTAPSAVPSSAAADERSARYRESVEAALEELIASSHASVEHLGTALRRVQEIAGQVQVVSQRATLVALHAVTLESRLPREERRGEDLSRELRLLTGEVRAAAQHADQLAADVERETRAADERMRSLRERMAPRLEPPAEESREAMPIAAATAAAIAATATVPGAAAEAAASLAPALSEHSVRLLERVREMIQDATQKGERLSAAGERASRTADRLLRRLEDEARDVEGLMVRLSPAGELPAEPDHDLDDDARPTPADLRLLEPEAGAEVAGAEHAAPPRLDVREERP